MNDRLSPIAMIRWNDAREMYDLFESANGRDVFIAAFVDYQDACAYRAHRQAPIDHDARQKAQRYALGRIRNCSYMKQWWSEKRADAYMAGDDGRHEVCDRQANYAIVQLSTARDIAAEFGVDAAAIDDAIAQGRQLADEGLARDRDAAAMAAK